MIRTSMGRSRALGSFSAAMGLFLAGAVAVTTGSAQSAEPAGDCAAAYPVADIVSALDADQAVPVTTKSVIKGTDPVELNGEVLGVIQDGIAFDVDMIMVKVTPPSPDEIGGIWQGMSGSPVYAADHRLIGAIAYGLSYGPSWIAGVTPFEDMDDYLAAPAAGKVAVGTSTARTIAGSSGVTADQAASGFTRLPMPTGVSGVDADRVAQASSSGTHAWLPKRTFAMGSSSAAAPGPDTIFAGGNLAASLSYGDVTQAGIGTATSVCDGRVVGFGHPMTFLGRTTLTMHPATALYVQPESLGAPFKVANLGAPAGTITDDHRTGITGVLGAAPETSEVTSTVSFDGRSRTGTSYVSVPQAMAGTVFYENVGNHDKVIDGTTKGSELLSGTITGDDNGSPFSLTFTNRYAAAGDITYESPWQFSDLVWTLSSLPGVVVGDVAVTSDVTEDSSTWRVSGLQQWRAGAWQPVVSGSPVLARAGKKLTLRVKLAGVNDSRFVPVSFMVPATAAGSRGVLEASGGDQSYYGAEGGSDSPSTVAEVRRMLAKTTRNDEVSVSMNLFGPLGSSRHAATAGPADKVVSGYRQFKMRVR